MPIGANKQTCLNFSLPVGLFNNFLGGWFWGKHGNMKF